VTGTWYNGYSWKQRDQILKAMHRGEGGPDLLTARRPCGLCNDPDRPPNNWHSEDYSPPYLFEPPATYPLCNACHGRIHKRFARTAAEWELFCRHVEAGGYGREFTRNYPPRLRNRLCAAIDAGQVTTVAPIRSRSAGPAWWRDLTLDPESLIAPWARPRPWRPRPDAHHHAEALSRAEPSEQEWAMLRYHAAAPHRTVTMRQIAREVLGSDRPSAANLAYGKLARRIGEQLDWEPDRREDGSLFWMSVLAEGWQPPSTRAKPREYELVMVPVLAEIVMGARKAVGS
jgi:hypothetical protein